MLKHVFPSIFLSFLHHPLLFLIDFQLIFHWFSVINKFELLTLVFKCCYILSIMCSPTITRAHKETKTRWSTREILPSFSPVLVTHFVISKQYNLGRTSSLNCWKTKSKPLAKCWGMAKPLPTLYTKVST